MKSRLHLLIVFIFVSQLIVACNQEPDANQQADFENLPVAELELISEFDQSGEHFFQHLNYETQALSNGDVILNDREGQIVMQISPQGDFIKKVAGNGNGPGEIQDPISIQLVDESTVLIVDQMRMRIIQKTLDSSEINEFNVPQGEASRVSQAYATTDPNILSVHWFDFSSFRNRDAEPITRISSYNLVSDELIGDIRYPGETKAMLLSASGQPSGATTVPYTPKLLYSYTSDFNELYTFWSENSEIAVLDPIQLDTVRTISVDLPAEALSATELDSLEADYRPEYWESVEELLPDQKVPADKMVIDSQDRIWLKLTLESDFQEWVVLDQGGTPQFRVQFPKEGMVTHISDQHIGFRADDHLFALYDLIE